MSFSGQPCELRGGSLVAACLTLSTLIAASSLADPLLPRTPSIRKPVAAIVVDGGLLTVNQQSHSLSLVDPKSRTVRWEADLGSAPIAIVAAVREASGTSSALHEPTPPVPANADYFVVDHADHVLRRVRLEERGIRELGQVDVVRWPVNVIAVPTGELVVVGLWSRRLQFLAPSSSAAGWEAAASIPLPFNPHGLLALDDRHLLVGDAFGGQIGIVDLKARAIASVRSIHGHNIRGLTLNPAGTDVYLTHQMLDEHAATTRDNVSLGILLSNLVRRIPLAALLDPHANLESESSRYFLGRTLEGAADPNGLAFDAVGNLWVALGGTNEVCEVTRDGIERRRVPVGTRPTTVLAVGDSMAVINTLADSVTLVSSETGLTETIALGPQRELTRAEAGERLFFDGRLSLESWMSCHSCHPDGHTHGLLADTASDGGFGNPKRTLSLLGTRDANPWAWTGQFRELHEQVHQSVTSSMQGRRISPRQAIDLVSFLHTLTPAPPVDEAVDPAQDREIERGRKLFSTLGCATCHIPPLTYTIDAVFDVGMSDERGQAKFNPPTLRGVSQRDRLFHDNRAEGLEAVLDDGHQLPRSLAPDEKSDVLRFLRSL